MYRIPKYVFFRKEALLSGNNVFVFNGRTGKILETNDSVFSVLDATRNGMEYHALVEKVSERFPGTERADLEVSIRDLLGELMNLGIVEAISAE